MADVVSTGLSEAVIDSSDLADLRDGFNGQLVVPGDAAYDAARKVWNGAVDRRPAIIAHCAGSGDVIRSLAFARLRGVELAVRSGGHNIAGKSVCENGLVIDLSRMKGIWVDPERRVARAEAGLTLGEFDAATQAFGLATTMGVNSDTGIAGLTLGGGIGRLGRKHGLATDNLISADVVTADGRLLRASAVENDDLFWAIRGGGGNFGIVTAFEFRLHPVGPTVLHAALTYDYEDARSAIQAYDAFACEAPDEVSADAALVTGHAGTPAFLISVCHAAPVDTGARVLERLLRPLTARLRPLEQQIRAVPYLEVQSATDSIFPRGSRYYWKAQFLKGIAVDAIDALVERFPAAPSPRSIFVFQHVGGAIARIAPNETAYANRDAVYDSFPISIWESPNDDESNIAWARELWAALRPFSTGGVYVNNLGEEGDDRLREAYGQNYPRLATLKRRYDPANLFRQNANILPIA